MTSNCPCGKPLHYRNVSTKLYVEQLIAELGETQIVTTPDGSWIVPRHYIALHGMRPSELPALAKKLGFTRVE